MTITSTLEPTNSAARAGRRSEFPVRRSPLDDKVFSFDVAKLAQAMAKRFTAGRVNRKRDAN